MKEKVASITKTFTDYEGNVRNFTIAAVSSVLEEPTIVMDVNKAIGEIYGEKTELEFDGIQKALYLGVSVQRPNDDFDLELGVKIAIGKAVKEKSRFATLYSTDLGLINSKMVAALLEQEAEFFISNPGKYLAGYNKDKAKYLAEKASK